MNTQIEERVLLVILAIGFVVIVAISIITAPPLDDEWLRVPDVCPSGTQLQLLPDHEWICS